MTEDLVSRLVAEQFPQWAGLPVEPVALNGWDNKTFRLGGELSVRLPSHDSYVAQIDKEHRWLPVLAGQLPLPIPSPVAKGEPGPAFPRPWSVYRWLPGEPALVDRIGDLVEFAGALAGFLSALYRADPSGPPPGPHSFSRGGPVSVWDEQVRQAIDALDGEIPARAVTDGWEAALASTWSGPPVWVHGDVVGSNLLAVDGRLHAVIDFGCSAVGDPACDLAVAWTLFSGESRSVFRAELGLDQATWDRGRGWALWKAMAMLHQARARGSEAMGHARRMGWRWSPKTVVEQATAGDG
jgi:aminoglycoside phosphotransferase (APT) family kinase protein